MPAVAPALAPATRMPAASGDQAAASANTEGFAELLMAAMGEAPGREAASPTAPMASAGNTVDADGAGGAATSAEASSLPVGDELVHAHAHDESGESPAVTAPTGQPAIPTSQFDPTAMTATATTATAMTASAMTTTARPAEIAATVNVDDVVEAIAESVRAQLEDVRAAGGALARGTAVSPHEGTRITRQLGALDPQFRAALERMIDRMTAEGHTVRVVETSRTQARQDDLWAQGRTKPGQVVTWTRQSRHLVGRAADVTVDGAWSGPGYARMHAIAREEGLHTLGARDPGHVELRGESVRPGPVTARGSDMSSAAAPSRGADTPLARAADATTLVRARGVTSSPVPSTATAARHAPAPDAAQRAVWSHAGFAAALLSGRTDVARASNAATARTPMVAASTDPTSALIDALELLPSPGTETTSDIRGELRNPVASLAGNAPQAGESPTATRTELPAAHALLANRIEQMLAAREQARARPMTELTLAVDAANGTTDRIRIGLAGRTLGATILTDDPDAARRMTRGLTGLSDALARTGIDGSALTVREINTVDARAALHTRQAAEAAIDPGAATAAARIGSLEGVRHAQSQAGTDGGSDSRRHDREQPQRQGGDGAQQQGEQRGSGQRRQRRDPREQPDFGSVVRPFHH